MLKQELLKRDIPQLKPREEMLDILQNEIYGRAIPTPESLSFSEPEEVLPRFLASKSTFNKIIASNEATKLAIVNISNKLFFLSTKNPAIRSPKQ